MEEGTKKWKGLVHYVLYQYAFVLTVVITYRYRQSFTKTIYATLYKQWHLTMSKRFIKPPYSINQQLRPTRICLKKKMNASRPSEHPPVGAGNVETFRWDYRLQRQNLFMSIPHSDLFKKNLNPSKPSEHSSSGGEIAADEPTLQSVETNKPKFFKS